MQSTEHTRFLITAGGRLRPLSHTRAIWEDALCRAAIRDDFRLGACLFGGALAFLLVMF